MGAEEAAVCERRVLVVDDDAMFAAALADALVSESGFEVVAVAHGVASGLQSASSLVDVALVDYRMPDGGGVEFARRLAEQLPLVAIVAMSGSWDMSSREAMLLAGAVATIDKAAPIDDICAVVRSARVSRAGERPEQS
jgi:DNA-binding NarL/FixJ family response regulator